MKTHSTNASRTFVTVAPDCPVSEAAPPPERKTPSVARLTFEMLAGAPHEHTSDDVFFGVFADRQAIPEEARPAARALFFSKGQPCFRASDLCKKYGWGVYSDEEGRVALYALGSPSYARLASGVGPDGEPITVVASMRSARR